MMLQSLSASVIALYCAAAATRKAVLLQGISAEKCSPDVTCISIMSFLLMLLGQVP